MAALGSSGGNDARHQTFDTNASDESGESDLELVGSDPRQLRQERLRDPAIIAVAVVIIGGLEIWPSAVQREVYILPRPSASVSALVPSTS